MARNLLSCLVTLLWVATFVTATSSDSPLDQEKKTILRPVNADIFEHSVGLRIRSSKDLSRMALGQETHMVFAAAEEGNKLRFANMTLYAPDGLKVVSMERFAHLTSSINCHGDDGRLSLTFSSREAFDFAVREWAWINANDTLQFLLVANHDGCGPDEQRQVYKVDRVTSDAATYTTILAATTAPWSEVAGSYDLDFGHILIPAHLTPRMVLHPRSLGSFFRSIGDGFQHVGKEIVKDVSKVISPTLSSTSTFDFSIGQPNVRKSIFVDSASSPPRLEVACTSCFLTASLALTGTIQIHNFIPKKITLSGHTPAGVKAALNLDNTIRGSISRSNTDVSSTSGVTVIIPTPGISGLLGITESFNARPIQLSNTAQLLSAPVPGAGLEIPGIFTLGAIVSFEVSVGASLNGVSEFSMGLIAEIPAGAQVTMDLLHPERSSQSGFEKAGITPNFKLKHLDGSLTVTAATQPKFSFGIGLSGVGDLKAGLGWKLPYVSATLDAALDEHGVCGPGSGRLGGKVSALVGTSLQFTVDGTIAGTKRKLINPITLFKAEKSLFSKCFSFGEKVQKPVLKLLSSVTTHSVSVKPSSPSLPSSSAVMTSSAATHSSVRRTTSVVSPYKSPSIKGTTSSTTPTTGRTSKSVGTSSAITPPSGTATTSKHARSSAASSTANMSQRPETTRNSSISGISHYVIKAGPTATFHRFNASFTNATLSHKVLSSTASISSKTHTTHKAHPTHKETAEEQEDEKAEEKKTEGEEETAEEKKRKKEKQEESAWGKKEMQGKEEQRTEERKGDKNHMDDKDDMRNRHSAKFPNSTISSHKHIKHPGPTPIITPTKSTSTSASTKSSGHLPSFTPQVMHRPTHSPSASLLSMTTSRRASSATPTATLSPYAADGRVTIMRQRRSRINARDFAQPAPVVVVY